VASVVWTRDAVGHVELPCAHHRPPIDTPLVNEPTVLVAMNEPSLKKFQASVRSGGWILYNGEALPRAANEKMCMCWRVPSRAWRRIGRRARGQHGCSGALLEIASVLPEASVAAALRRLIKTPSGWSWMSAPGAWTSAL